MSEFGAGVEFRAPVMERYRAVLTPEAVAFVVGLQRAFNARRKELLAARVVRQARLDAGEKPDFLPETKAIRESEWTVAPLPADLLDRRVEITGPVDRKMIINALNSGAKVFMADFEDSTTPTWENVIDGQINLKDAIRRTITFEDKTYRKELQTQREAGGAVCAAAGVASGGGARGGRWRADVRLAVRFRVVYVS